MKNQMLGEYQEYDDGVIKNSIYEYILKYIFVIFKLLTKIIFVNILLIVANTIQFAEFLCEKFIFLI